MGGWDSCCVVGWLLAFVFSLAIPVEVAQVAGVLAVSFARGGPLLIDFHSLRNEIYAGVVA